jgi:hypothetical protein
MSQSEWRLLWLFIGCFVLILVLVAVANYFIDRWHVKGLNEMIKRAYGIPVIGFILMIIFDHDNSNTD